MAQAVYDPLRKKYVWVPMGIINEFDAMKMLLAGGQTPNKILSVKQMEISICYQTSIASYWTEYR